MVIQSLRRKQMIPDPVLLMGMAGCRDIHSAKSRERGMFFLEFSLQIRKDADEDIGNLREWQQR